MATYAVYVRGFGAVTPGDVVVVREGFSVAAALVPVFWALWHRHVWAAAGYLAFGAAVVTAAEALPLAGLGHVSVFFGLALLQGLTAPDVRRWSLQRAGYTLAAWGRADDADAALAALLADDPDLCAGMAWAQVRGGA